MPRTRRRTMKRRFRGGSNAAEEAGSLELAEEQEEAPEAVAGCGVYGLRELRERADQEREKERSRIKDLMLEDLPPPAPAEVPAPDQPPGEAAAEGGKRSRVGGKRSKARRSRARRTKRRSRVGGRRQQRQQQRTTQRRRTQSKRSKSTRRR